jgi:hypothetical protein
MRAFSRTTEYIFIMTEVNPENLHCWRVASIIYSERYNREITIHTSNYDQAYE